MLNEKKTEKIVRNHFLPDELSGKIVINEQQSDNSQINKLLKFASKSGFGKGYPDFIIEIKNEPKLIIVIECKADLSKHESLSLDNSKNYAVDGALLYSKYLSKNFDVISIGVSGQNNKELKVTHNIQLQNFKISQEKQFANQLMQIDDYIRIYKNDPQLNKRKEESLLKFSKKLNNLLHSEKIESQDRALLIAGIYIALLNKDFRENYENYTSHLNEQIFESIERNLEKSLKNKSRNLMNNFTFLKNSINLKKTHFIKNIIREVKIHLYDSKDQLKTYDYLSKFYIEFLRYSNMDKGMGIVLTPEHISSFMAKLVEVNENSKVYDNCTGTSGFLVSAMKIMINKAFSKEKKELIKKEGLMGNELSSKMYALSVCNMYIHQDGKSNIKNSDCFNKSTVEWAKQHRPNVGLLNPPYRAKDKNAPNELSFVENNLECLLSNSLCAAIVPMSTVLASNEKTYEIKKRILKKNTLVAVLSMPPELFHNSNTSVHTAIIVFKSKIKHPPNKEIFFGSFKDDGFVKRRNKGRIDANKKWVKIEKEWLDLYRNRKESKISLNKFVTADDEWVAEAYLKVPIRNLKENFIKKIKDYICYLVKNLDWSDTEIFIEKIKNLRKKNNHTFQEPDSSNWKEFKYSEIFNFIKFIPIANRLADAYEGSTPLVSCSKEKNGIVLYSSVNEKTNKHFVSGSKITIAKDGAGVCSSFYQKKSFFATSNVVVLDLLNKTLNWKIGLFLCTIVEKDKIKYSYGRKLTKSRMNNSKILLPVSNNKPNWKYMEDLIDSVIYFLKDTKNK